MRGCEFLLMWVLGLGLSWAGAVPDVQVQKMGSAANWYAVQLTVRNTGDAALDRFQLGWHYTWSDHGASGVAVLDYSSVDGALVLLEERDDFSATAWIQVPQALPAGGSAEFHLRLHTQDWGNIDATNDPSFVNGAAGITVMAGTQWYLAEIPRLPFPTPAVQKATVKTQISQHTSNTLGLVCRVQNEGEVPLRQVTFSWFTYQPAGAPELQMTIDYSPNGLAYVEKTVYGGGLVEFMVHLPPGLLAVGAQQEVHLRLHSPDWAPWDFTHDYSYAGLLNLDGNPQVAVRSDGLLVGGVVPQTGDDSDGDGLVDDLEEWLGSDPLNPDDAPLVGIPDQLVLPQTQQKSYVVYDFSHIPGYTQRKRIAVPVEPGTLQDNRVPTIEFLGESCDKPLLRQQNYHQVGGFFRVHANVVPGQEIRMAIPLTDDHPSDYAISRVNAWRFDTSAHEWQPLSVTGYNGAVQVKTQRFSDVQVGIRVTDRQVGAGENHLVALDNQQVWRAGGASGTDYLQKISGLPAIRSVAAGAFHGLALDYEGGLWAWGDNRSGQLGNALAGDSSSQAVRVVFPEGVRIVQVSAGGGANFAQDDQLRIWAWGANEKGQLGLGHRQNIQEPVLWKFPEGVRLFSIAVGNDFAMGLDSASGLWTWGRNDHGQLLVPQSCPTPVTLEPGCVYKKDSLVYPVAKRSLQGLQATREKLYNKGHAWWNAIGAGDGFAVAKRYGTYDGHAPIGQTFAWGKGMAFDGYSNNFQHQVVAGAKHFALISEETVTEFVLRDPAYPDRYIGSRVVMGDTLYEYYRRILTLAGDNSTGALGVDNPTQKIHTIKGANIYDYALGNGFTVLWYGSVQRGMDSLRVLGSMGAFRYGHTGKKLEMFTPLLVAIEWPLMGQKVVKGASTTVRWTVNGVLQDSATVFPIPSTAKAGTSLTIVRAVKDKLGRKIADSVRVVVDDSLVRNVRVEGSLLYPNSRMGNGNALAVHMDLTDSSHVTLVAKNGKGAVDCEADMGYQGAGERVLKWDGLCQDGKWIPEGVHQLDLRLRLGDSVRVSRAPAWVADLPPRYASWDWTHDVYGQVHDSLSAPADQWVAVDALAGNTMQPAAQYQVLEIHELPHVFALLCGEAARVLGNKNYYRITPYRFDSRTFVAQVLPTTAMGGVGWWSGDNSRGSVLSFTAPENTTGLGWKSRLLRGDQVLGFDHTVAHEGQERQEWWSGVWTDSEPWLTARQSGVRMEFWWSDGVASSQVRCIGGVE